MPERSSFEYAIVRVVPRVDREEFINAGALLYCRAQRFLGARVALHVERLAALGPLPDLAAIRAELDFCVQVCAGDPAAGPIAALSQAERFRWLTSPRNTVVQMSLVHPGLCVDPQTALDELFAKMVT